MVRHGAGFTDWVDACHNECGHGCPRDGATGVALTPYVRANPLLYRLLVDPLANCDVFQRDAL